MRNENVNEPQNKQSCQNAVSGSAFLSGKCEESFINFYTKNRKYKYDIKQYRNNLQASIIINWLDEIGYTISLEVIQDKEAGYVRGFDSEITFMFKGDLITINSDCLKSDCYETRDEAILKAIQKASESFNTINFDSNEADR